MADCGKDSSCLNKSEALHLKIGGIAAILVGSAIGVGIPLVFRDFNKTKLFFAGQCFAAGVILATGFVHILPDAFESLTSDCLGEHPWGKFPFTGFIAMTTAMFVLLLDSVAMKFYMKKASGKGSAVREAHLHAHAHQNTGADLDDIKVHSQDFSPNKDGDRDADFQDLEKMSSTIKNKVVAQVLEFGILTHSVIIGIAMGASESPCTIRPLVAALVFHQLFEGLALGGCIAKGGFENLSKVLMSLFFSITTPGGIAIGIAIASGYNENDPKALVIQGVFDSMSAGILIYMALVDLLASIFLSDEFLSHESWKLYCVGYISLFLGAILMSIIAIWA